MPSNADPITHWSSAALPSWILAIDFGTSYTVAASKTGDRAPEVIEVGGERRMPSVIMADPSGSIIVGRTADDLSGTHPGSTLRAVKNRIGDQAPVVLDGRPYQVVDLVAALLRSVYAESVRQMGQPPSEVRLTHPAMWNRPRLNRLLEAATKAGLPNPALVPEPVAAALSFASEVGVAEGAYVVVYDLGGGTFDSAVVTASGGGFNIVGRPGGDQNIGGELFDELIVNSLGLQLPPDAWNAIQIGEEPLWQQVGATLRNEARRAKETLSGNPYADLIIPLPTGLKQIRLMREEFEDLASPYIAETIVLLDRCVHEAGLQPSQLSGISLVGGSSRSPIVELMVKEAFPDVPVIRRGDPKTAVASGAARAVRSSVTTLPPADSRRTTQQSNAGTGPAVTGLAPPSSPPAPNSQPSSPPVFASGPNSQPPAVSSTVTSASAGTTGTGLASSDEVSANHRKPILISVAGVVIVAVVVGIILFAAGGGAKSAKAQPTRRAITGAILTIGEVRDTFGAAWNAEDLTGSGDPFCPQFALTEPLRQSDALYMMNGSGSSGSGFYENISSFADETEATKFYDQDKAISQNCNTSLGHLGTVPVTYTITDVTSQATPVGREVVAVKYVAVPTNGSTGVKETGYLVEAKIGRLTMSTNFFVDNREPMSTEVANYYDLTKVAFDKAVGAL
jgi:actin-like ATPase involved in cell morphogenesis